jgi:hypothetical protein
MGSTFRTDRDMSDANEQATILDRVWAATQPPDLSTAEADRIWAEVLLACERPSTLTMDSPTSSRSRRFTALALVGFAAAQAAAIVVAVWLTVQPNPRHRIELAQADPVPAKAAPVLSHDVDVDPYEMIMVSINAQGSFVGEQRIKPSDSGSALALGVFVYADLPVNNGPDLLSYMESKSP